MASFLATLLSNAVAVCLLAGVVAVIACVVRRPPLVHTLWLIVLAKLLTPPLVLVPLEWPFEANMPQRESPAARQSAAPTSGQADLHRGPEGPAGAPRGAGDTFGVAHSETAGPSFSDAPEGSAASAAPDMLPSVSWPGDSLDPQATSLALDRKTSSETARWRSGLWPRFASVLAHIPPAAVGLIWLAGSVVWLGVAFARVVRFRRLLRHGMAAPEDMQRLACSVARRMGIAHAPTVWLVPGRVSPLLWAVGRARLVVPAELLGQLSNDQSATLLAHELAHARRRDHWVRWLEFAAIALYWWHPVAWWARRELRRVEEECCDAWVVRTLPDAARDYAETLLQTIRFLSPVCAAPPPAASGIGHVHQLRRRLTMILRETLCHRVSRWTQLAVFLIGATALPVAPRCIGAWLDDPQPAVSPPAEAPSVAVQDRPSVDSRLQQLEEKMDRVLRALEAQTKSAAPPRSRRSDEPRARVPETLPALPAQAAPPARVAAPVVVPAPASDAAPKARPARIDSAPAVQAVEPMQAMDEEQMAELGRQIAEAIQAAFDPESLGELGRQIGEVVRQAIDPKQMEQLGRDIAQAVNQGADPENAEELERRIEQAIEKSFSPERMEEMERQIETTVEKLLESGHFDQIERRLEEAFNKKLDPTYPASPPKSESPARPPVNRRYPRPGAPNQSPIWWSPSTRSAPVDSDIEKRIRALEEKMDRVLRQLESPRNSAP